MKKNPTITSWNEKEDGNRYSYRYGSDLNVTCQGKKLSCTEQFSVLTQFRYAVKENTVFTNNSKRSHLNFRAENKCPNLIQFLSNFWLEIICWFSNTVYRFWWKPRLSHRLVSGSSAGFFLKKKENKKYTTDTYMQTSRYTS